MLVLSHNPASVLAELYTKVLEQYSSNNCNFQCKTDKWQKSELLTLSSFSAKKSSYPAFLEVQTAYIKTIKALGLGMLAWGLSH